MTLRDQLPIFLNVNAVNDNSKLVLRLWNRSGSEEIARQGGEKADVQMVIPNLAQGRYLLMLSYADDSSLSVETDYILTIGQ